MKFCIVIKCGVVVQVIGDPGAEFAVVDFDVDGGDEEGPTLIDNREALVYDVPSIDSPDQDPELRKIFTEAFGI